MNKLKFAVAVAIASISTVPALADNATTAQTVETQRDINQQQRIENGLDSGQLSSREAGLLEREESHVDRMESHAAADGTVSKAEAARINAVQNAVSRSIYAQKHDGQVGNPDSASSQRIQAQVQRDVNQETRINEGVKSGELTTREAGRLERGQARVAGAEANAAVNGHVSGAEATRVRKLENRQSRRIYNQKHDEQAN